MLPKRNRLPVKDFPPKAEVLFRGKKILAKRAPSDQDCVRLGVSISSKNVRKAAARNSIKRLIFKHLGERLREAEGSGFDLLIIVTSSIIKLDPETRDELLGDLRRAADTLEELSK